MSQRDKEYLKETNKASNTLVSLLPASNVDGVVGVHDQHRVLGLVSSSSICFLQAATRQRDDNLVLSQ